MGFHFLTNIISCKWHRIYYLRNYGMIAQCFPHHPKSKRSCLWISGSACLCVSFGLLPQSEDMQLRWTNDPKSSERGLWAVYSIDAPIHTWSHSHIVFVFPCVSHNLSTMCPSLSLRQFHVGTENTSMDWHFFWPPWMEKESEHGTCSYRWMQSSALRIYGVAMYSLWYNWI